MIREVKMLRILILGDFFMRKEILRNYLFEYLKEVDDNLDFRLVEWGSRGYQKGEAEGVGGKIKEFSGDPSDVVKFMEGVNVLVTQVAPVTAEVMDASDCLKVIGCTRGGPVNVDIMAATQRGIPVIYTPGRNGDAVADYTMGLILAETRNIARAHAELKKGIWRDDFYDYELCGYELAGKTLGIIGFGFVGKKVALRAKAFGMEILVYDPYIQKEEVAKFDGKLVDLPTLLQNSDFVTIHARLTSETEKLIGARELSMMKKTAYIINTARGKIIDEKALTEALMKKTIAGAALDVFEDEPISKENPLLSLDNVTITPHIAGAAKDVVHRAARMLAEDIMKVLKGEKPTHCANPSVLEKNMFQKK